MRKLLTLITLALSTVVVQAQYVTNYYTAWSKWNSVPVSETDLDYSTGTHWVMFTRGPQGNGTFDPAGSGIDGARDLAFVQGAHAAGAKAIIGTGGWGADYTGVVTNRSVSIPALVKLMDDYGYDGVDIDWEPVPAAQYANFAAFIRELKAAKPNMLLFAACFNFDQAIVDNQQYFDQINLMTYDMSGAWNPVSWHNSPLYSPGGNLGSITGSVASYVNAGVPKSKLGFGIELYAYVWNGVTGPQQSPFGTVQNTVHYWTVMQNYYDKGAVLKYDSVGGAYYYSTPSQFVSMDFEESMQLKADYVRREGLGGVIVYDAGVGRVPGQNPPDRIMQQIKHAFLGGAALDPLPYVPPPPPPTKHSYVVYDNSLQSGFWNSSWVQGGLSLSATDPVDPANTVVSVGYRAWDGFRVHTGTTWGDQKMISSDTLVFDIYPVGGSFTPTVLIEGGIPRVLSVPMNRWTRLKVACPPTAFSWFYIQNNTSSQAEVLLDNIRLVAGADSIPPIVVPPPPTGGRDTIYVNVIQHDTLRITSTITIRDTTYVPYAVHDTVTVYPVTTFYEYVHSQSFPINGVILPEGFIVTATVNNSPSVGRVTIRGLRPRY